MVRRPSPTSTVPPMPDRGATGVLYQIYPRAWRSMWWPWPWVGVAARSAKPQYAARQYSRPALLVYTRTRPRYVGPHGTIWPQAGDWLVPVSEHCGQQLRRLAFGQPRPGRNAELT